MATWTNTAQNSSTWTNTEQAESSGEGEPIGLLLTLTHAETMVGTSWTNTSQNSSSWTNVSQN